MNQPDEWPEGVGHEAFADFVDELARRRWGRVWNVEASPPSPGGKVDVRLTAGSDRWLVRFHEVESISGIGASEVRTLADLRDDLDMDRVVLATTGRFSGGARSVADDRGVDLVGPEGLLAWAREAGVAVPEGSTDEISVPDRVMARYAAYWPDPLVDRASEVLDALTDLADFEYVLNEGAASTELRCVVGDRPAPVLVRFGETHFLVYVREDGEYESVVQLTAYRETQPSLSELRPDLQAAVERAL